MLQEMTRMNTSMNDMEVIMKDMHGSTVNLEEFTPNFRQITTSVGSMTQVMTGLSIQMGRITFLIDKIEDKLPAANMILFW